MADPLRINARLAIPLDELEFRVSRSSGPGGQGVNTTDSRVELRFDLAGSPSLDDEQRARLRRRLAGRVDSHGVLRVVAQTHRSQLANREAAVQRFARLLADALRAERPRRPTRPTAASKARRRAGKAHRASVKRLRQRPPMEED